jgi:threonine dehydrogenase-like Zn-dependent dehydrogenase
MPDLLNEIESGTIDPSFVISHRLKLSEAPMAYEKFNADKDPWRKVVLSPN